MVVAQATKLNSAIAGTPLTMRARRTNTVFPDFMRTLNTMWLPSYLPYLAAAYADLGQYDDAWRCSSEAIAAVEKTKERVYKSVVLHIVGQIALKSPQPDAAKAQAYFERALTVARQQQTKSWELRAAMSMARLWRDQGKRGEGPRTARSSLGLVHRRFQHARPERG